MILWIAWEFFVGHVQSYSRDPYCVLHRILY
jgi:hypothetical protein